MISVHDRSEYSVVCGAAYTRLQTLLYSNVMPTHACGHFSF